MLNSPTSLLRLDAAGAFVSALLILCLLPCMETGMPLTKVMILGSIPIAFFFFDMIFLIRKNGLIEALRVVAYLNLSYVAFSLLFVIMHYDQLTWLGWTYFVGESILVGALAMYEMKITRSHLRQKR